jgi:hypothetical protein
MRFKTKEAMVKFVNEFDGHGFRSASGGLFSFSLFFGLKHI